MTVIACIDGNTGMMFNNRRQTRDKAVVERIIELSGNSPLWMSYYSKTLFADYHLSNINTSEVFISCAEKNDFCFIENSMYFKGYEKKIDKLILFSWNTVYPADDYLNIDLSEWLCVEKTDFEGNSHECITERVYVRKN